MLRHSGNEAKAEALVHSTGVSISPTDDGCLSLAGPFSLPGQKATLCSATTARSVADQASMCRLQADQAACMPHPLLIRCRFDPCRLNSRCVSPPSPDAPTLQSSEQRTRTSTPAWTRHPLGFHLDAFIRTTTSPPIMTETARPTPSAPRPVRSITSVSSKGFVEGSDSSTRYSEHDGGCESHSDEEAAQTQAARDDNEGPRKRQRKMKSSRSRGGCLTCRKRRR